MEYRNCNIARMSENTVCVLLPKACKLPRESRKVTLDASACDIMMKHGKIVRVIDTATDTMYFTVNCRDHRR